MSKLKNVFGLLISIMLGLVIIVTQTSFAIHEPGQTFVLKEIYQQAQPAVTKITKIKSRTHGELKEYVYQEISFSYRGGRIEMDAPECVNVYDNTGSVEVASRVGNREQTPIFQSDIREHYNYILRLLTNYSIIAQGSDNQNRNDLVGLNGYWSLRVLSTKEFNDDGELIKYDITGTQGDSDLKQYISVQLKESNPTTARTSCLGDFPLPDYNIYRVFAGGIAFTTSLTVEDVNAYLEAYVEEIDTGIRRIRSTACEVSITVESSGEDTTIVVIQVKNTDASAITRLEDQLTNIGITASGDTEEGLNFSFDRNLEQSISEIFSEGSGLFTDEDYFIDPDLSLSIQDQQQSGVNFVMISVIQGKRTWYLFLEQIDETDTKVTAYESFTCDYETP